MKDAAIVQFEDVCLTADDVKRVREKFQRDAIDVISLRNCTLTDKDYKLIMKAIAASKTLRHVSLSLDQVTDKFRVQLLAQAVQKNISIVGLHLHGNPITDDHMVTLHQPIYRHSRLICLDFSDCNLGDDGVAILSYMLRDKRERHGLHELRLSHNVKVTAEGWRRLAMALAAGSSLRGLFIDYNVIGDTAACCLVTALPGATQMETLDMECTGITDVTGQVLLNLVKCFRLNLKTIILKRNNILKTTKATIKLRLNEPSDREYGVGLFNADFGSDDNQSLATSEPPLEIPTTCEYNDYANMTRRLSVNVTYNFENETINEANESNDASVNGLALPDSDIKPSQQHVVNLDSKSLTDIGIFQDGGEANTMGLKKTVSMDSFSKVRAEFAKDDNMNSNVDGTVSRMHALNKFQPTECFVDKERDDDGIGDVDVMNDADEDLHTRAKRRRQTETMDGQVLAEENLKGGMDKSAAPLFYSRPGSASMSKRLSACSIAEPQMPLTSEIGMPSSQLPDTDMDIPKPRSRVEEIPSMRHARTGNRNGRIRTSTEASRSSTAAPSTAAQSTVTPSIVTSSDAVPIGGAGLSISAIRRKKKAAAAANKKKTDLASAIRSRRGNETPEPVSNAPLRSDLSLEEF